MNVEAITNMNNRLLKILPDLDPAERGHALQCVRLIQSVKKKISSSKETSRLRERLVNWLDDLETNITDFEVIALLNRQKSLA